MSAILGPLLPDPPGTWVRPDQWPPEGWEDFDPTRTHHKPVAVVTLTAPNRELDDDDHTVQYECWWVTPVGGSATWDDRAFPRGSAVVEIPPFDAVAWAPGPGTHQPEEPTITPDAGVPWAATPWGTLIAVYAGWDTPDGCVGVRVFDGVVTGTDFARPGDSWQLTAADFTSLLDDTQAHQDRALWALTESVSQPPRDDGDGYRLRTAVKFLAREATENWWPLPLRQLPYNDPDLDAGVFGFTWNLDDFDDDRTLIDADTNMGGQSLWAWVEQWCDLYGVEAAIIPGAAGTIRVADTPTTTVEASRHTFAEGSNLLAWTARYERIVNRALVTLETRGPRTRRDTLAPSAWAAWDGEQWQWTWEPPPPDPTGWDSSHHAIRLRWQGLEAVLEVDTLDGAAVQLTPHSVLWGDDQGTGRYWVQDSTIDEAEVSTDDTLEDGKRRTVTHRYDNPGRYAIIAQFTTAAGYLVQLTAIRDFTDLPERTFAMQGQSVFESGASSVRRSGRKTWTGVRRVARWFANAETEDREDLAKAWANKMRNRVRGRERSAQLHVIPAPWITPGDTIRITTNRLGTQRMTVAATTVPLRPTPDGMTIDAGFRDLAPGDDTGGNGGGGGNS